MGILDDAIGQVGPTRIVTSMRVERLISQLVDAGLPPDDHDRLQGMLRSSVNEWGHTALMRIIRLCCDELGVTGPDVADLNYKNVEDYRKRYAA